jgi:hypothetical protein
VAIDVGDKVPKSTLILGDLVIVFGLQLFVVVTQVTQRVGIVWIPVAERLS